VAVATVSGVSVAVVAPASIVGAQRAAGDPFLLSGSLRFPATRNVARDLEGKASRQPSPAYFCSRVVASLPN